MPLLQFLSLLLVTLFHLLFRRVTLFCCPLIFLLLLLRYFLTFLFLLRVHLFLFLLVFSVLLRITRIYWSWPL